MTETVLAAAAATWGVVMALAPLLQVRRMLRRRSSRDVSIGSYAVLVVGFALWVLYGAASGTWALVVPNAVAFVVGLVTIVVANRFRMRPGGDRTRT